MREGAFGLSTGLEYEAAQKSSTEEIIALAQATARYGGIYISHVRDEAQLTFPSFEEAIRIGAEAHVPVQISHIKMGSMSVWGRAPDAVKLIESARASRRHGRCVLRTMAGTPRSACSFPAEPR